MEHFKQFANLDEIDRKSVAILIKCIKVINKREIKIVFNYEAEYEAALALLAKEVS